MNDKPKIGIYETDDWVALYVDGELKAEGHSLSYSHIFDALGIKATAYWVSPDEMEKYMLWSFAPNEEDNPDWMRKLDHD